MKYTVYTEYVHEVTKKLNALKRKAEKYNIPFSYDVGEEHVAKLNHYDYDDINHCMVKVCEYSVSAVDIVVNCDDIIKANGWSLIAKIEHTDKGNLIYPYFPMSDAEMEKWSKALPYCEHCHTKRKRNMTYVCKHENGDIKQIGSTCLREYTGICSDTAVLWATIKDTLENGLVHTGEFKTKPITIIKPVEIIAYAIKSINDKGYVKSELSNSTKEDVYTLLKNDKPLNNETMNKAKEILNWLKTYNFNCSDFEYNASIICKNDMCKLSQIGLLVYMPIAYEHYQEKQEKLKKKTEIAKKSEYVGNIKDRLTFKATAKLITSFESYYGLTFVYRFIDENENIFTWFASSTYDIDSKIVTIKGTVKEHKLYNNEKQTILTRCKIM